MGLTALFVGSPPPLPPPPPPTKLVSEVGVDVVEVISEGVSEVAEVERKVELDSDETDVSGKVVEV